MKKKKQCNGKEKATVMLQIQWRHMPKQLGLQNTKKCEQKPVEMCTTKKNHWKEQTTDLKKKKCIPIEMKLNLAQLPYTMC